MQIQDDYLIEVSERCTDSGIEFSIGNSKSLDGPIAVAQPWLMILIAETAYRRGYHQGFDVGHDADGVDYVRLCYSLHAWRYSKHDGKFERPPE